MYLEFSCSGLPFFTLTCCGHKVRHGYALYVLRKFRSKRRAEHKILIKVHAKIMRSGVGECTVLYRCVTKRVCAFICKHKRYAPGTASFCLRNTHASDLVSVKHMFGLISLCLYPYLELSRLCRDLSCSCHIH